LQRSALRGLRWPQVRSLALLGLVMYAFTQGSQFLALAYLPAQTTSLVLSFSPALVALLGAWLLSEPLRAQQWLGVALYLSGVVLYFFPADLPRDQLIGLAVVVLGLLANAAAGLMGRAINRSAQLGPLTITVVSMGVGSLTLLGGGVAAQGVPELSPASWGVIAWLAVVNTAFAFTLWNHTLRTLTAMESSIINNTMLIQIAFLAWIFLDESLNGQELTGLVMAAVGTLVVQLLAAKRQPKPSDRPAARSALHDEGPR
jgi:drug/metabolite transporter (DMT)-like permease